MGSMLHLLDNFENLNLNKPIVDVPDFNNPNSIGSLFIKNEPFRKYICHNVDCFNKAKKSKKIEKVFETQLTEDIYNELEEMFKE